MSNNKIYFIDFASSIELYPFADDDRIHNIDLRNKPKMIRVKTTQRKQQ